MYRKSVAVEKGTLLKKIGLKIRNPKFNPCATYLHFMYFFYI